MGIGTVFLMKGTPLAVRPWYEGQILSMMELVKDDFAGYKEKEFLEAVYSAISNDEAIMEEKDGRIAGMLMDLQMMKN